MVRMYSKKVNLRRKKRYTFEALSTIIHNYLKEEGYVLNLKGYRETLLAYRRMVDNHTGEFYELMIETSLWANYMSELEAFIQLKKEEWTLERDYLRATENLAEPSYELEQSIQKADEKRSHYALYEKEVRNKKRFFQKAHIQCRELYRKQEKMLLRS